MPAIALYPDGKAQLPLVILLHWFQGRKEVMEPWAERLAPKGFFVLAVDLHLHGERAVDGIFGRPDLPALGAEFSVYIHQSSIAHSARDVPVMLKSLAQRREIDMRRVGVAGFSMGASLAMVLAWQNERITTVVSLAGASDFWWDVTKTAPGPAQEAKRAGYGPRVTRLVNAIDPSSRLDRFAPKAVYVASGRRDHFIDIESIRRFAETMRKHYGTCPERFRFREEDAGHEFTETMRQEADRWLVEHLQR